MNKRIRELAERAGFSAHRDGELYTSKLEHLPITDTIEKFAELIVKECAVVADQWVNDEDNGHNLVSDRLRQHFGVD